MSLQRSSRVASCFTCIFASGACTEPFQLTRSSLTLGLAPSTPRLTSRSFVWCRRASSTVTTRSPSNRIALAPVCRAHGAPGWPRASQRHGASRTRAPAGGGQSMQAALSAASGGRVKCGAGEDAGGARVRRQHLQVKQGTLIIRVNHAVGTEISGQTRGGPPPPSGLVSRLACTGSRRRHMRRHASGAKLPRSRQSLRASPPDALCECRRAGHAAASEQQLGTHALGPRWCLPAALNPRLGLIEDVYATACGAAPVPPLRSA